MKEKKFKSKFKSLKKKKKKKRRHNRLHMFRIANIVLQFTQNYSIESKEFLVTKRNVCCIYIFFEKTNWEKSFRTIFQLTRVSCILAIKKWIKLSRKKKKQEIFFPSAQVNEHKKEIVSAHALCWTLNLVTKSPPYSFLYTYTFKTRLDTFSAVFLLYLQIK